MSDGFLTIVDQLGGGLGAIVVAALGWVCWWLLRRMTELQDKRVEDAQAYARGMAETAGVIERMEGTVRDMSRELRDLRVASGGRGDA